MRTNGSVVVVLNFLASAILIEGSDARNPSQTVVHADVEAPDTIARVVEVQPSRTIVVMAIVVLHNRIAHAAIKIIGAHIALSRLEAAVDMHVVNFIEWDRYVVEIDPPNADRPPAASSIERNVVRVIMLHHSPPTARHHKAIPAHGDPRSPADVEHLIAPVD